MNLDLWRDLPFFRDSRNMTERPFRTDIKDEGDHYLLESELPGFDRDNIKVKVEDGYLTVRAERKEETDERTTKGVSSAASVHTAFSSAASTSPRSRPIR